MPTAEFTDRWYTLIRYRDSPENLTAVAQAKTATEAHLLHVTWMEQFPGETALVFDPENAHLAQKDLLHRIVQAEQAAAQTAGAADGHRSWRAAEQPRPGYLPR